MPWRGPKHKLPDEAIEWFFVVHGVVNRAKDNLESAIVENLETALTAFRMAATNLPSDEDLLQSTQEQLNAMIKVAKLEEAVCAAESERQQRKGASFAGGSGPNKRSGAFASHDMQEIIHGLFVGSHHPAKDLGLLQKHSISRICCCVDVAPPFPEKFTYLIIPAADANGYNLAKHFDEAFVFIDEGIAQGQNVLVHCGAGISRGPAIAASYLVRKLTIPAVEAVSLVHRARDCANPNDGFMKQLTRLSAKVMGSRSAATITATTNKATAESDEAL